MTGIEWYLYVMMLFVLLAICCLTVSVRRLNRKYHAVLFRCLVLESRHRILKRQLDRKHHLAVDHDNEPQADPVH